MTWQVVQKNGYIWITNGKKEIKISLDKTRYGMDFAKHEADRRNKNPDVNNFSFQEESIKRIVNNFAIKKFYCFQKIKFKVDYETVLSDCYLAFVKAQNNFIPGDVTFLNYYKAVVNTTMRDLYNKIKRSKKIKIKKITDHMVRRHKLLNYEGEPSSLNSLVNNKIFDGMSPRNKIIMESYFNSDKTLHEIGSELKISKQAVQQVVFKQIQKIKDCLVFKVLTKKHGDSIMNTERALWCAFSDFIQEMSNND